MSVPAPCPCSPGPIPWPGACSTGANAAGESSAIGQHWLGNAGLSSLALWVLELPTICLREGSHVTFPKKPTLLRAPPAGEHAPPTALPARPGQRSRPAGGAPGHGGARRRAACPGAREGWERTPRPRRRALADAILRQDMLPPRGPAPAPRGRRAGALA